MTTNESTIAALPENLILGTVSYSVKDNPELAAFRSACVAHAAQTEKTKLYSQMSALKDQVNALKDVKITDTAPAIDVISLKSEIVAEMSKAFGAQLDAALTPLKKQSEDVVKQQVNEYRNQLLIANQGKCIPELIVGETKEALDEALTTSLKIFAQYGKQENSLGTTGAMQTHESTTTPPAGNTTSTAQTTISPSTTQTSATTEPVVIKAPAKTGDYVAPDLKVKSMTASDYAKQREQLLKNAESLVG